MAATAVGRQDWRHAYDTQLDLARWVKSDTGKAWIQYESRRVAAEYNPRTQVLIHACYEIEEARLAEAVPYFVSPDMCRMVEAAAPGFEPEPIYPTDVLTMSGFVYFAKPLSLLDRFGRPGKLVGFSWHPMMTGSPDEDWVSDPSRVLTRDDEYREYLEERHKQGRMDGLSVALYSEFEEDWGDTLPAPPILPMHCTPWWWGMSFEGNEVTEQGRPSGTEHWWKIVQTTLRLMQQRVSVHHTERPDRATRRYAKRLNLNDRGVTVVTLRRERSQEHVEPQSEFHYSHRFIVKGHWRRQHYADGIVRQIYIADFEKGPEGAPLIIKPRVYRWTR